VVAVEMIFSRGLPRLSVPHSCSIRDNQQFVKAGKRVTHSLDGSPINFTVLRELREVVNKRGVNYSIGTRRSTAQAFEVFHVSSMHMGTSRS